MKRHFLSVFILTAITLLSISSAVGQSAGNGSGESVPEASIPFTHGEKLTFDGRAKIGKILPLSLAEMTFTLNDPQDDPKIFINAEARSKGSLIRLAKFSFLQKVDSTIDPKNFAAQKTIKFDQQKDRIRTSETTFDYEEERVTYVEVDPNDNAKPPRTIASEINGETHDILSAIYKLRVLPLEVGKTFELAISDSGLVYNIPVKVVEREEQKTIIGKVWCFRIEAEVFGDGRLIEQSGSLTIWITDDARRLPVRGLIKTKVVGFSADVDVKLKEAENLLQL